MQKPGVLTPVKWYYLGTYSHWYFEWILLPDTLYLFSTSWCVNYLDSILVWKSQFIQNSGLWFLSKTQMIHVKMKWKGGLKVLKRETIAKYPYRLFSYSAKGHWVGALLLTVVQMACLWFDDDCCIQTLWGRVYSPLYLKVCLHSPAWLVGTTYISAKGLCSSWVKSYECASRHQTRLGLCRHTFIWKNFLAQ